MALRLLRSNASVIEKLNRQVAAMGGLVESQLGDAINAIERRDVSLANAVIARDVEVDARQVEIEDTVVDLFDQARLSQRDIRHGLMCMKIATGLERIGDLSRNVCKRSLVVSSQDATVAVGSVVRMGQISLQQLSDVLNALSTNSADAALAVWGGDDQLDELYNSIFAEILHTMTRDPSLISACTHLVFAAKNFERVGDHATNIAEQLYQSLTGEQLQEDRPKRDLTSFMSVDKPAQSTQ